MFINWLHYSFMLVKSLQCLSCGQNVINCQLCITLCFNTLKQRQNDRHFPDDIFKCIFLNENVYTSIKISLQLVPKGPINNNPALVHIMAWRRPGDKPLSEPMMFNLQTPTCVARPQYMNVCPTLEKYIRHNIYQSQILYFLLYHSTSRVYYYTIYTTITCIYTNN